MMKVEIDMVVTDSLEALKLYEKVFNIERIEVTDFPNGENEVIFSLYGVRFHMLDENPSFDLIAPKPEDNKNIWMNVTVSDITETYKKAIDLGCTEEQPVTEIPDYGLSNAAFMDPFGYQWMLQQVYKEVSHEERTRLWEEKGNN